MAKKIKALHHQPGRPAKEFVLIKKHANKTADFGLEDGTVVCEGCPIGPQEDATRSYVILVEDEDPKASLLAVAKAARAKATQLSKAATEAAKAADAAKGKEGHEALVKAAAEATEAAKAADTEADAAEDAAK